MDGCVDGWMVNAVRVECGGAGRETYREEEGRITL